MKKKLVHVALCQRSALPDKDENLRESIAMIEEAVRTRPDLDVIVFPEYNYYVPASRKDAAPNAETEDGPYISAMREQAAKYAVNLVPGSFLAPHSERKTRNRCVFLDRRGELAARYDKIHLMDAIGANESGHTEPGSGLCLIDADFGRVGMLVCFDLRFPEMPRSLVLQGADMLICPSCFPFGAVLPPRTDHWDTLVAGAALYNLTWMCAVNQYGSIPGAFPFGRSRVVDPWGTVTASASGRREIVYATLDMNYQNEIRESLGTLNSRCPDVYRL